MNKKKFYAILGIVLFAVVAIFGYLYYKKISPSDLIASVPVGDISQSPEFKSYIFGPVSNTLVMPLGVTVDGKEVYVADSDGGEVQVFDYNGKALRTFGKTGKEIMNHPYGLAFYNGELYVADGGRGKIMIFDRDGNFKRFFEPKEGYFSLPAQIVVKDNRIAFTDLALNKVLVYNLDGTLEFTFGRKGEGDAEFLKPHGLAMDSKGNFYVADANNNRVQMFNSKGKFVKILGNLNILTPRGVFVDSQDRIYVVSGLGGEVFVFSPEGEKQLIKFGNDQEKGQTLSLPGGIWIDGNKIFVTETLENRLSVFEF